MSVVNVDDMNEKVKELLVKANKNNVKYIEVTQRDKVTKKKLSNYKLQYNDYNGEIIPLGSELYIEIYNYLISTEEYKPSNKQYFAIVEDVIDNVLYFDKLKTKIFYNVCKFSKCYHNYYNHKNIWMLRFYKGNKIPVNRIQNENGNWDYEIDFNKLTLMFNDKKKFDEMDWD